MKKIEINESFDLKTIQVSEGDTVTIRLEESPTTGYVWEVAELDEEEIELTDQHYQLNESAGIGGGGIKTFNLKVLQKRAGTLRLENRQRWEGDIYRTFTLHYE